MAAKSRVEQLIKAVDVARLYRIIQGMIGKRCWQAAFTYGGDLRLQIGARIPYKNPNMAGKKKGSWIFGTCGTPWVLITPEGSVSSGDGDEEELEERLKVIQNSTVIGFGLSLPNEAVSVTFSNKCRLDVTPTARDRKYGLPYWELFTPDNRLVAFGAGGRWSHKRADVPPNGRSGSPSRKKSPAKHQSKTVKQARRRAVA